MKQASKNKPLQYLPEASRFPVGRTLTAREEQIIQNILYEEKISEDFFFNQMPTEIKHEMMKAVEVGLNTLGMQDRDRLIEQTSHLYHADTLENVHEQERIKVLAIMVNVALNKRRFTAISELVQLTGYSRKRINNILRKIAEAELKPFMNQAMREAMLAKIFTYGLSGNVKAARLFMELTDPNPTPTRSLRIQNQNNLVQMNGVVITEEQMKSLPAEEAVKLQDVLSSINVGTLNIIPIKS